MNTYRIPIYEEMGDIIIEPLNSTKTGEYDKYKIYSVEAYKITDIIVYFGTVDERYYPTYINKDGIVDGWKESTR